MWNQETQETLQRVKSKGALNLQSNENLKEKKKSDALHERVSSTSEAVASKSPAVLTEATYYTFLIQKNVQLSVSHTQQNHFETFKKATKETSQNPHNNVI